MRINLGITLRQVLGEVCSLGPNDHVSRWVRQRQLLVKSTSQTPKPGTESAEDDQEGAR